MDVASSPLPPATKERLLTAGFRSGVDIVKMKPVELAKEIGVSASEALALIRSFETRRNGAAGAAAGHPTDAAAAATSAPSGAYPDAYMAGGRLASRGMTVLDIVVRDGPAAGVITWAQALDDLLGGTGTRVGEVTEFCGIPGIGKTQIGMQVCVCAAIPAEFGGVEGEALFIDTEGSFMPVRAAQMAKAMVDHLQEVNRANPPEQQCASAEALSLEGVLAGIHVVRCTELSEFMATVLSLDALLEANPRLRVVVVDSIAFHFRHDQGDMGGRSRALTQISQALHRAATTRRAAVVVINHVTTQVLGADRSRHVPALGETWAHACTNRIMLFWRDGIRVAQLLKSASQPLGEAAYAVERDGIRDVKLTEGLGEARGGAAHDSTSDSRPAAPTEDEFATSSQDAVLAAAADAAEEAMRLRDEANMVPEPPAAKRSRTQGDYGTAGATIAAGSDVGAEHPPSSAGERQQGSAADDHPDEGGVATRTRRRRRRD